MDNRKDKIEDFLLDSELTEIAEENDKKRLRGFKKKYPGYENIIDNAFLLMRTLKVKPVEVSQSRIEEEYEKFRAEIRRRRRMPLWISVISAACACLLFILFMDVNWRTVPVDTKSNLFSLLDSLDRDATEIQIVSGETKTLVADNQEITQTDEGNILVGEEEKIKSTDIKTEFIQLVVPHGKRTNITFHDGTVAWLNSGSKLLYPKVFSKEKREIYIEGEIYIEVEKDAHRPFLVHTKRFDVSVLGTKFNVNAYEEDEENSVVLVEGKVEVSAEATSHQLAPNQGYFIRQGVAQTKEVDIYTYICWKEGLMKVNGETLGNMFIRLSRHYNVQLDCKEEEILNEKYRGKLNLGDSVEEILDNLSLTTPFAYEKQGNKTIRIYLK